MLRVFTARTSVLSATLQRGRAFFSSVAEHVAEVPKNSELGGDIEALQAEKSKRQQLREVQPDMKLLNHLDSIRLGYLAKRSNRKAVVRKIDNSQLKMESRKNVGDSYSKSTPFPFKAKGKMIHHAYSSEDLARSFEGNPPEIALIGRSNVGKSTLLNALVGFDASYVQKATMSDKPGQTKQLSFFQIGSQPPKYDTLPITNNPMMPGKFSLTPGINNQAQLTGNFGSGNTLATMNNSMVLDTNTIKAHGKQAVIHQQKPHTPAMVVVDMPGYGFAYMNDADKARCDELCTRYLFSNIHGGETGTIKDNLLNFTHKEKNLKRVLLLLDARHGLKLADIQYFEHLYDELVKEFAHLKEEILTDKDIRKINKPKNYINSNNPPSEHMSAAEEIESKALAIFHSRLRKLLGWKLQIVLTKCDLLERTELCRRIQMLTKTLLEKLPPIFHNTLPVVVLSGREKKGLLDLQNELSQLVDNPKEARDLAKAIAKKQEGEQAKLAARKAYEQWQLANGKEHVKKSILAAREQEIEVKKTVSKQLNASTDKIINAFEVLNKGSVGAGVKAVANTMAPSEGTFTSSFESLTLKAINSDKNQLNKKDKKSVFGVENSSFMNPNAQVEAPYTGPVSDIIDTADEPFDFNTIAFEKSTRRPADENKIEIVFKDGSSVEEGSLDAILEGDAGGKKFASYVTYKQQPAAATTGSTAFDGVDGLKLDDTPIGSGTLFKPRKMIGTSPNDDVYGEFPRKAKQPRADSPTAHLTPQEHEFRVLHEKPYHPSAPTVVDFTPSEVFAAEFSGVSDDVTSSASASEEGSSSLQSVEETVAPLKAAAVASSESNVENTMTHTVSAAAQTRGRKRAMPIPVRVDGKISFAEVAVPGENLDFPSPKAVLKDDKFVKSMTAKESKKEKNKTKTVSDRSVPTGVQNAAKNVMKMRANKADYTVEFDDEGNEIVHKNEASLHKVLQRLEDVIPVTESSSDADAVDAEGNSFIDVNKVRQQMANEDKHYKGSFERIDTKFAASSQKKNKNTNINITSVEKSVDQVVSSKPTKPTKAVSPPTAPAVTTQMPKEKEPYLTRAERRNLIFGRTNDNLRSQASDERDYRASHRNLSKKERDEKRELRDKKVEKIEPRGQEYEKKLGKSVVANTNDKKKPEKRSGKDRGASMAFASAGRGDYEAEEDDDDDDDYHGKGRRGRKSARGQVEDEDMFRDDDNDEESPESRAAFDEIMRGGKPMHVKVISGDRIGADDHKYDHAYEPDEEDLKSFNESNSTAVRGRRTTDGKKDRHRDREGTAAHKNALRKQEKSISKQVYESNVNVWKHASTEGFIKSAYDDNDDGSNQPGPRLNRKLKRQKKQIKEAARKEGKLFD